MTDALTRFDSWLLDRVFQPVVDRVSDFVGPAALAESALLGSAIMTLGEVAVDLRTEGLNLSTILFGALNLAGAVWLLVWYRSHGALSGRAANPFRVMPVWVSLRLSAIANLVASVVAPLVGVRAIGLGPVSIPLTTTRLATAFDLLAAVLCVGGLYFAACNKPPPKIHSRVPVRAGPVIGAARNAVSAARLRSGASSCGRWPTPSRATRRALGMSLR